MNNNIELHVENPLFEKIQTTFRVKMYDGYQFGYYKNLLEQEMKDFLSPWAFQDGKDLFFGGEIHSSMILAFVESRPYVDYVTEFKMYKILPDNTRTRSAELATASSPKVVLVSNEFHTIESV
jgi:hypothetical protein